jgi:DeoR family suf operon transcriptional repressor
MPTASAAPSPTQRRLLAALKRSGDATAEELATTLEISSSAVRQHLRALRSAGLIAASQDRGQLGRPAHRYHATDITEPMFVTADTSLSVELLEHIEEEDPELVNRVFQRRRRRLVENAQDRLSDKTVAERVNILTDMLDEQGYLADFEKADHNHYRINLHSCPMWAVVTHYTQACTSELEFLRDLMPDATVDRVTNKTAGAHTCTYEMRFRTEN